MRNLQQMQEIAQKIEAIAKQRFAGSMFIVGSAQNQSPDKQTFWRVFINQLGALRNKTVISSVASFEIWPHEEMVRYYIGQIRHAQTVTLVATLAAEETNLQFLCLSSH